VRGLPVLAPMVATDCKRFARRRLAPFARTAAWRRLELAGGPPRRVDDDGFVRRHVFVRAAAPRPELAEETLKNPGFLGFTPSRRRRVQPTKSMRNAGSGRGSRPGNTRLRTTPSFLAGEADPPPHRSRHAASPASAPDGRRGRPEAIDPRLVAPEPGSLNHARNRRKQEKSWVGRRCSSYSGDCTESRRGRAEGGLDGRLHGITTPLDLQHGLGEVRDEAEVSLLEEAGPPGPSASAHLSFRSWLPERHFVDLEVLRTRARAGTRSSAHQRGRRGRRRGRTSRAA
jgi:hypothetical protein